MPYLSQHSYTMAVVWGVTVMLVLAAASVRADDLRLDVMQDELLGGEYYPTSSNNTWYIKFSASVEGEDIVSVCEIWSMKGDYFEVTDLKIPYRNKHSRKVDQMRTKIISAAKATAQVLKFSWVLPAAADDIAEAYWNMADSLARKTADMEKNQVRFAVMYHSIIIRAALRIMNGAKQTKDICQVSPDYEHAESSMLFICTQDLPHLNQSLLLHDQLIQNHTLPPQPQERPKRFIRFRRVTRWVPRIRIRFSRWFRRCSYCRVISPLGRGLCGSDHGCCGNYNGCCIYAHSLCYLHDKACTCCAHWWCLWDCKCDSGCSC